MLRKNGTIGIKRKTSPQAEEKVKLQFVDANTGTPTELEGDALETAKLAKSVITKGAFDSRKYHRQLVDANTGKFTELEGEALEAAKQAKIVITKSAFASRKYNLVCAYTGRPTELKGEELERAKEAKDVVTRYQYEKYKRKLFNLVVYHDDNKSKRKLFELAVQNESKSDSRNRRNNVHTTSITKVGLFQPPSQLISDNEVQIIGEQTGKVDTMKLLLNVATIKQELLSL